MNLDNILGCFYGLGIGDAWGAETEFLDLERIYKRWPPDGPNAPEGDVFRVTDDTQMTIAVAKALVSCTDYNNPDNLEKTLRKAFSQWFSDPENNRAPGNTCLEACCKMDLDLPWWKVSQLFSKGCGANMRVAPVAFIPCDLTTKAAIAQFQSAITHGHPTALAACDVTSFVICELARGLPPEKILPAVEEYIDSQKLVYHEKWLGLLFEYGLSSCQELFIYRGWMECLDVIQRIPEALKKKNVPDPCLEVGAGWVAEEAFATALYCFLSTPEDPMQVLKRAAVTSGDSDSIACLAGAFTGAYLGKNAWPDDYISRLEYQETLTSLATTLFSEQKSLD